MTLRPRTLAGLVLPVLLLFSLAVAQKNVRDDEGMRAMARAKAAKRAQEALQRRQEAAFADSAAKATMGRDDRGDFNGQGRDTQGALHLLRAGEIRQIKESRGEVSIIERSVKMIQDSLTMWCDSASYRQYSGVLDMFGDVLMMEPRRSLRADRVSYFEDTRQSLAEGNVHIKRDSLVMTCSRAQYDDVSDVAIFETDVVAKDLKRDVILTGGSGDYWTERQFGRVPEDPVLITLDSTGAEEARIVSEYMEYDALRGHALARDSVTITWHEVRGWGDELHFYPDSSRALLLGNPLVLHDRDEVHGDSIWLYMNEESLDSAVVVGHAVAYTPSDTLEIAPRSSLKGRRIVVSFVDGDVNRMASFGQAIGIYHIFQDGDDQGTNRVTGDEVVLQMENGELADVTVVGGTEGMFYPPRLAKELRDE